MEKTSPQPTVTHPASDDAGCFRAEASLLSRAAMRSSGWLAPHQTLQASFAQRLHTQLSRAAMRGSHWLAPHLFAFRRCTSFAHRQCRHDHLQQSCRRFRDKGKAAAV